MNDGQLRDAMKKGGITDPALTMRVAREVGLPLAHACAVLELETSGGLNLFGSDSTYHGPYKGMEVTKDRYASYLAYARQTGQRNGVGYTQLTSGFLQDRADALGGCWKPEPNMRVGFSFLRALIRQYGNAQLGFTHYNGSSAYGRRAIERSQSWARTLGGTGNGITAAAAQPHGPFAADFVSHCLGAAAGTTTAGGAGGLVYPGPARVHVGNRPYQAGTTHGRAFNQAGGTDNWESEAAFDLYFRYGTPVVAVADGTIGTQFGALNSAEPRLAGLRLHLLTPTNEFYYAHLSAFAPGIRPGVRVRQGEVLGRTGRANGVEHLHLAAKVVGPLIRLIDSAAGAGVTIRPPDAAAVVQSSAAALGLTMPRSAATQLELCQSQRTTIATRTAIALQGALLFRSGPSGTHVAVSLGNGTTLETTNGGRVGRAAGARTRSWTLGALVPGLQYSWQPMQTAPPFPGRLLIQPPAMHGADVATWQRQMRARGWTIVANGIYDAGSAAVCAAFQREKSLRVDGVVRADTWRAAWEAPIT